MRAPLASIRATSSSSSSAESGRNGGDSAPAIASPGNCRNKLISSAAITSGVLP